MNKILTATLAFAFSYFQAFSQDTIIMKSGEEIKAKVEEINLAAIKYKRFDNLEGPLIMVAQSDVLMVRYENGTKFIPKELPKRDSVNVASNSIFNDTNFDWHGLGQRDAIRYYGGYTGAGTGTLVVSLISPLVGLIPAIACSATTPKDQNLMYPKKQYMMQPDYSNGYTKQAKKIKSNHVWTNWGIALGVNLVLVLVLSSGGK